MLGEPRVSLIRIAGKGTAHNFSLLQPRVVTPSRKNLETLINLQLPDICITMGGKHVPPRLFIPGWILGNVVNKKVMMKLCERINRLCQYF